MIITFIFLFKTIPVLIYNVGVFFGIIGGNIISIESTIDQTTIWGMFSTWLMGERNVMNSIVSWIIIALLIKSLKKTNAIIIIITTLNIIK